MDLMARWPRGVIGVVNATGIALLVGRVMFNVVAALVPSGRVWEKALPYVKPADRSAVATGARIMGTLHGAAAATAFVLHPPALWLWAGLVPAHALLSIYITCEHRGLPMEGTTLERTRSLDASPFVTWMLWNMPYHAEHHAWPAVPFHALPALSDAMGDAVVHRTPGPLGLYLRGG